MKKTLYILLFTIFGILFQFLAHAVIETLYIKALMSNFSLFGLGLSWDIWFAIHYVGTIIFFVGGFIFGVWGGFFFWKKIYVENKYGKKRKPV